MQRLSALWIALVAVVVLLPDLQVVGMSDDTHMPSTSRPGSLTFSASPPHHLLDARILAPMLTRSPTPTMLNINDADVRFVVSSTAALLAALATLADAINKYVIAPMHGTVCAVTFGVALALAQRAYRRLTTPSVSSQPQPGKLTQCEYCSDFGGDCGCLDDEFIQMYHRPSFSTASRVRTSSPAASAIASATATLS